MTTTTSVDQVLTALGLGALAILFATDRVMTKGQHTRRVADLTAHHNRELATQAGILAEMRESRDYYRQARLEERARADAATDRLAESVEVAKASLQALQALDEAARSVT
ncbi:hypothetical protein N8K70_04005 [Microbacterium betulae]|uniref:Uncharacterized protein n=1 Tax=Microbacterium betulae TaxID=2981139 RepID=A0AA97FK90_9MICO|nr:hypothetical protein [Microbacterium sp. AB]WOF23855.1 hypothetical protein N8K70_04005 [Microbacterium sp. AB]